MAATRPTTPESRSAQASLAVAVREHGPKSEKPDPDLIETLRANWEAERYIAGLIAAAAGAPPIFTADQRRRLVDVMATIAAAEREAAEREAAEREAAEREAAERADTEEAPTP